MYKLHSISIFPDSYGVGPEVILPDFISASLTLSPQLETVITAGDITPSHLSLIAQEISQEFQTNSIIETLDAIGVTGLCIQTDTNPGIKLYLQQFDECGNPMAGAVHRSYGILAGRIFPTTLTCQHRQDASIGVQIMVLEKPGQPAIIIDDTATLPTLPLTHRRHTLIGGKSTMSTYPLSNQDNLAIDFGNDVQSRGVDSEIYDTLIEQRTHSPMIDVTGIDPTWFSSTKFNLGMTPALHTDTAIYLQQRAESSAGFEPIASTVHIQFTMSGVVTVENAMTAGDAVTFTETALKCTGRRDNTGSNPLIYAGDVAIP